MPINNSITTALPEDVEKAVEVARNNITLMQVETTRLIKLKTQLEKDILVFATQKKSLEDSTKILEEKHVKIETDLQVSLTNLNATEGQLGAIKDDLKAERDSINSEKIELQKNVERLENDKTAQKRQENVLEESVKIYEKDKQKLEEKKAILLGAINQL